MSKMILVVHGMRTGPVNEALKFFIDELFTNLNYDYEVAFLESETKSLKQVIEKEVSHGVRSFHIVPLLLFEAKHFLKDIPETLNYFVSKRPGILFKLSKPIGNHPVMRKLIYQKVKYKINNNSAIVVLAHGSERYKQPDKSLEMLCAHLNLPHLYPLMIYGDLSYRQHLQALAEEYSKVYIIPYFMFDGYLVKKTKKLITNMKLPTKVEFTEAINFDPLMIEAITDNILNYEVYADVSNTVKHSK